MALLIGGVDDVKDELLITLRKTFFEVFLCLNLMTKNYAKIVTLFIHFLIFAFASSTVSRL